MMGEKSMVPKVKVTIKDTNTTNILFSTIRYTKGLQVVVGLNLNHLKTTSRRRVLKSH